MELPRRSLVVFTGVSARGKSSLAFVTVFTERRRRYAESLSAYARKFLGQLDRPDADTVEELPPAIAVDPPRRTLRLPDEPTTGPHPADGERLRAAPHRLLGGGNTFVVTEHHLGVVRTADRPGGIGPEGGHRGGQVIAAGTPEQNAVHPGPHTGRYPGALLEETI